MKYLLLSLLVLFAGAPATLAQLHPPVADARYDESKHFIFRDNELTTIQVNMSNAHQDAMYADPWNNVEYPCTIRFTNSVIDEVVNNVSIRVRGATSRGSWKKSFKISFNTYVPGTRFHGVKKFNVIGAQNDVSIVRAKLSLDVMRRMGLPTQQTALVRFRINGGNRADDVYVVTEQVNDDFLKAWYGNDKGNLIKGAYQGARADFRYVHPGTASTYFNLGDRQTYVEENNEDNPDFTKLADLIRFINFSSDQEFYEGLPRRINMDSFLRAMAADVVVGNWDNVWFGSNNWYIYDNPATGLWEWIPYDYDNTYGIDFFGVDWARRPLPGWGNGGFGSNPDITPLMRRILAVPLWEGQLRRHIADMVGRNSTLPTPVVYEDPAGDTFLGAAEPHFDLVRAEITNTVDTVQVTLRTKGPIDVGPGTDQARFMVFLDAVEGGRTDNPWGRDVLNTVESDYFIGFWTDGGGGHLGYQAGPEGWTLHSDSGNTKGLMVDLNSRTQGIIRLYIPMAILGLEQGGTVRFDVVSTHDRSAEIEPGVDHFSNPLPAGPDYDTPSTPGPFLAYTIRGADPAAPDPVFSLNALRDWVDLLRELALPYAFMGPTSGSRMDHGWTNAEFSASFTTPATYVNNSRPWRWGVKPYISTRSAYLRATTNAPSAVGVVVNEVLPLNYTVNPDEGGVYESWIELYNTQGTAVDLGGIYLSDTPLNPRRWKIPAGTVIPARGHLLFWADMEDYQGSNHAGFFLSPLGNTIGLYDRDERSNLLINSLQVPAQAPDVSWGRYPDGGLRTMAFSHVTPAAPNDPLRRMTMADAVTALRAAGGLDGLGEGSDLDLNGDGAVDMADAGMVALRAARP